MPQGWMGGDTMADKKGEKKGGGYKGKRGLYKVSGKVVERLRKPCPKCGPGTFLALHANRTSCGHCGYTEFKATKPE